MDATEAASHSRLLAALEPDDLGHLAPHLERIELEQGAVLLEPHAAVQHIWFPESCVVSLTVPLRDGGSGDAATVGREGMTGFVAALGARRGIARYIVPVPGAALCVPVDVLLDAFEARPPLRAVCLRYLAALTAQFLQSAACNRAHTVEARLCRWLLWLQDRLAHGRTLPLTQEFLAEILGVRRTTVTVAAQTLQRAGLIRYRWGSVTVLDRAKLEEASCECYGAIRAHYERLFPRTHGRRRGHPRSS